MTKHEIYAALVAIALTIPRVLRLPAIKALLNILFRKGNTMSATTTTTAPLTLSQRLEQKAQEVIAKVGELGQDWQTFENSPTFSIITSLLVQVLTTEFGTPEAGSLVNLGKAVNAALVTAAALSPKVATP